MTYAIDTIFFDPGIAMTYAPVFAGVAALREHYIV